MGRRYVRINADGCRQIVDGPLIITALPAYLRPRHMGVVPFTGSGSTLDDRRRVGGNLRSGSIVIQPYFDRDDASYEAEHQDEQPSSNEGAAPWPDLKSGLFLRCFGACAVIRHS